VRHGEQAAGWLFISPVVLILGVFMLLPIPDGAVGEPQRVERAGQPVPAGG